MAKVHECARMSLSVDTARSCRYAVGMSRRVLYVEDDDLMRGSLARAMEAAGFEVTAAANGDHALAVLQSDAPDPDVIVLDLVMPKVDGWEFLGMAREDALIASIPIIVTTSCERSGRLPPDVVILKKPFEIQELISALHAAKPEPR